METIIYESQQNGYMYHYYENPNVPCSPAVLAGNLVVTDGNIQTGDLIQLDAVPVRHNGIAYNRAHDTDNTWHDISCDRG